jgi:ABC-type Zn uptake system ZnuABC Zn-binding protein ZnuA
MLGLVVAGLALTGCRDTAVPERGPEIAVTNSYLACVSRDLVGEHVNILCLAPPGMCPGHFDVSPAQIRQLRNCRMLLLFDFQQQIEQRLFRLQRDGLKTYRVQAVVGLCVPDTYRAACKEVCRVLSREYPNEAAAFTERLSAIEQRLERLSTELRASVVNLHDPQAKVLTSNHQSRFAEWLGLEPVATFIGSDLETIANVDHCLKKAAGHEIRFVIANRQEGTALAEALADRLHARAVVFSNFPEAAGRTGFDRLVRENVHRLLEAGAP